MITSADYITMSNALGELDTLGALAVDFLDEMETIRSNTTIPTGRTFDMQTLQTTISITQTKLQTNHVTSAPTLIAFVAALQQAVMVDFLTVDAYLSATSTKASADFAALSAKAGYPISSSNVST